MYTDTMPNSEDFDLSFKVFHELMAKKIPAFFLNKNSPTLHSEIRSFFINYLASCIYERRKGRQKGLITELVSGSFDPDADFIKPTCCPTITGIGLFDLSA